VKPTSLDATVYEAEVAPPIGVQFWPFVSQSFHW
jgi:hypothetical protein